VKPRDSFFYLCGELWPTVGVGDVQIDAAERRKDIRAQMWRNEIRSDWSVQSRSGVVKANRQANIPVETGSRHVGQGIVDEEVPAAALIVSDIQPWQYTCPLDWILSTHGRHEREGTNAPHGRATGALSGSRQIAQMDMKR